VDDNIDDAVSELIRHYNLVPLPVEGTLYASSYVSAFQAADGAPQSTAIVGLYARKPLSRSLFHRLTGDEIWHFYGGDPFKLVLLYPDRSSRDVVLGPDHRSGQVVQFVVPAGVWQAGELGAPDARYALFGCTMAPGFTGAGFTGGRKSELLASHPDRADDIDRLAMPDDEDTQMPNGFTQ
jgi:predicted cupin superfamily sugar epimerase